MAGRGVNLAGNLPLEHILGRSNVVGGFPFEPADLNSDRIKIRPRRDCGAEAGQRPGKLKVAPREAGREQKRDTKAKGLAHGYQLPLHRKKSSCLLLLSALT